MKGRSTHTHLLQRGLTQPVTVCPVFQLWLSPSRHGPTILLLILSHAPGAMVNVGIKQRGKWRKAITHAGLNRKVIIHTRGDLNRRSSCRYGTSPEPAQLLLELERCVFTAWQLEGDRIDIWNMKDSSCLITCWTLSELKSPWLLDDLSLLELLRNCQVSTVLQGSGDRLHIMQLVITNNGITFLGKRE